LVQSTLQLTVHWQTQARFEAVAAALDPLCNAISPKHRRVMLDEVTSALARFAHSAPLDSAGVAALKYLDQFNYWDRRFELKFVLGSAAAYNARRLVALFRALGAASIHAVLTDEATNVMSVFEHVDDASSEA